jgi:guanylate kinase
MRTAARELQSRGEFDHVVVNDRLEQAIEEIVSIVRRALCPGDRGGGLNADAKLSSPNHEECEPS